MKRKQFLITIMMVITVGIMTGCGSNNTTSNTRTDDVPDIIEADVIDVETYVWGEQQFELDIEDDGTVDYVRYPGSNEILTRSEMSEEEVSDWLAAITEYRNSLQ